MGSTLVGMTEPRRCAPRGVLAREGEAAVGGSGEVEGGALDPALAAAIQPSTDGNGVDTGAGEADVAGLALGAVHGWVVPNDGCRPIDEFDAGRQLPLEFEGNAGGVRGQGDSKTCFVGAGRRALEHDVDLLAAVVVGDCGAEGEEGDAGG